MHISIMLVFWSLVRNSVVLAVYFLFSVTCFFTVHEHYDEESYYYILNVSLIEGTGITQVQTYMIVPKVDYIASYGCD